MADTTMRDTVEKPCPFCGGKAYPFSAGYYVGDIKLGFSIGVMCEDCHGAVISNDIHKSMNDMKNLWNRRTGASIMNPDSTSIDDYMKRWEEEKK